ncbi:MAG: hypothetical protein A2075_00380 [Geobacteraceae bacterium GWC2_58_44]|nr:MAG: hypothetical protein A2075_00380 [Geobacteraceae bacterium GWC2_58_44]HBG07098.1 hypothetical protein [Geobacter sp.]
MKTSAYLILATCAGLFAGCATAVPGELVNARSAYQVASEGPAQQLAPAELHKAQEALSRAEQSFRNEPRSSKTRDLAYVAERKAQQAGALGFMAAAKANKDGANTDFQKKQSEIVRQGKQDLSDSEKRTADARAELDKEAALRATRDQAHAELQMQQALIAQGKQEANDAEKLAARTEAELQKQAALKAANDKAHAETLKQQADMQQAKLELSNSEQRASDALASLALLATMKEEERGIVVTLTGSVLFGSAQSNLMPSARVKLDQVANALLAIPARNIIIEGHTDSQGTDASNRDLSQRRSDAVRDYLVQKGYRADHIQSHGRGEGSPIAKNDSAEGRANNRRVEIIIEREPKPQAGI